MPTPQEALAALLGGPNYRQRRVTPTEEYGFAGDTPTQGELSSPFEREQRGRALAADAEDRRRSDDAFAQSLTQTDLARQIDAKKQNDILARVLLPAQARANADIQMKQMEGQNNLDVANARSRGMVDAAKARQGGMGNMASSLKERVAGTQTSLDTLDNLERSFKDSYVGPLEGRVNSAKQSIPFLGVDKDFARFSADTSTLTNAVIKAITGAQMSEPEAKRIKEQVPSINDKPDVWRAKAAATKDNLRFMLKRIGELSGSGSLVPDEQPDDPYSDPNWGR